MVSERTQRRRRRRREQETGLAARPSLSDNRPFTQITKPGNYFWGGVDYDEVHNTQMVSFNELQLMLDMDGQARGLYNILRRPIQRAAMDAYIRPPRPKQGVQETEFIESNLLGRRAEGGMTVPFFTVTSHMTTAYYMGFKAFQKVFDRPGTVIDDNYIRLRKLQPVDSRTVTFKQDDGGGFDGFIQRVHWRGRYQEIPVDRKYAVYYAVDEEENQFYGKPYFLPAYYHFDKKHKLYFILHLALAVSALPPRVATALPNIPQSDVDRFLDALSNLGTNSAMILPNGFELLDHDFNVAASGMPFMEIINHHDLQMSKSMLAQMLDVGTSEGGGGFSLSKNHLDLLMITLESEMYKMTRIWNEYVIPELVQWNFGANNRNLPVIEVPRFADQTKDVLVDVFGKILSARNVPLSTEFLSELEKRMAADLDFDIDDVDIEGNAEEQAGLKKAQAELEMEMSKAQIEMEEATKQAARQAQQSPSVRKLMDDPKFRQFANVLANRMIERQRERTGTLVDEE